MIRSVSNIAWAPDEAEAAYALLRDAGVTGLEIAPALFLPGEPDPMLAPQSACAAATAEIARHGLRLTSMQSLLFGAPGAALFGDAAGRAALDAAMERAIALAGRLGVPNLVFGSPRNRVIPDGMAAAEARAIWCPAFRRMGDLAAAAGTVVALEPNPVAYGTNFMVTLAETLQVVRAIGHGSVRATLDLGAILMTGEFDEVDSWIGEALPLVNHVHLSAPHLSPLAGEADAARRLLAVLSDHGWTGAASIEMRAAPGALPAALEVFR